MKKNWFVLIALVLVLFFGISTVNAETHSRFVTGFTTPEPSQNTTYIIANTLNFGDLKTKGVSGADLSGVSKGDTVNLLPIAAGTLVKSVGIYIKSAWSTSGATCYGVTIGDASDADGWITAMDWGQSASGVSMSSGTSGFVVQYTTAGVSVVVAPMYQAPGGKYYATADNITATIPSDITGPTTNGPWYKGGLTDFQMQIWAECVKPSTQYRYKRVGN